jgi:hypothetical protein
MSGRLVRAFDWRALNSTRISWDGRTASGMQIKRGVYFVQCRFNDKSVQTQKLIIQK